MKRGYIVPFLLPIVLFVASLMAFREALSFARLARHFPRFVALSLAILCVAIVVQLLLRRPGKSAATGVEISNIGSTAKNLLLVAVLPGLMVTVGALPGIVVWAILFQLSAGRRVRPLPTLGIGAFVGVVYALQQANFIRLPRGSVFFG